MSAQESLFGDRRLQMTESIAMTIASLQEYGPRFNHWSLAWSGGKDSTTLVTLIIYLLIARKIQAPKTLTVLYADTRMELLPLWAAAAAIREELADKADALAELGVALDVRTVMAPMDKRFLVYILGRGVPPPNNNTLRWCTRQIKIDPMVTELERLFGARGEKLLMLTGVRLGESAARDGRIALSCGTNGGECGQGWYQKTLPGALCDTLAPVVHWRVCHIWEWLRHWAPTAAFGDWSSEIIADAYGGDEAEEINARTGCVGCPLASKDTALDAMVAMERWAYLAPLKELRELYRALRTPPMRLRKRGGETRKDGSLVANQQRMGPITLEARSRALAIILDIQCRVNAAADQLVRPRVDILNEEEVARIRELIEAKTWPQKWAGDEPTGDMMFDRHNADGSVQPLLWSVLEERL